MDAEQLDNISIKWLVGHRYPNSDLRSFKEGYKLCAKDATEKILNELDFGVNYDKNQIWSILNEIL